MTGRITLVGAGELMAAMSSIHRAALRASASRRAPSSSTPPPASRPTSTRSSRRRSSTTRTICRPSCASPATAIATPAPAEVAAAVAEIRAANLIFAGPGSPTYAISQWRDSPVWEAVVEAFEAGADLLFASAASISLGRYALPVYEIYKAGEDPFWADGLDLLPSFGLNLAVVPHFDDNSGGENYDSRFCYMGAKRFDVLQERLPPDVTILGIDAYTGICFDPNTRSASVSGQGGVTLIGEGGIQRFEAGSGAAVYVRAHGEGLVPFAAPLPIWPRVAGARIKRAPVLVDVGVDEIRVLLVGVVEPVAMVDVDVHVGDALYAETGSAACR